MVMDDWSHYPWIQKHLPAAIISRAIPSAAFCGILFDFNNAHPHAASAISRDDKDSEPSTTTMMKFMQKHRSKRFLRRRRRRILYGNSPRPTKDVAELKQILARSLEWGGLWVRREKRHKKAKAIPMSVKSELLEIHGNITKRAQQTEKATKRIAGSRFLCVCEFH